LSVFTSAVEYLTKSLFFITSYEIIQQALANNQCKALGVKSISIPH